MNAGCRADGTTKDGGFPVRMVHECANRPAFPFLEGLRNTAVTPPSPIACPLPLRITPTHRNVRFLSSIAQGEPPTWPLKAVNSIVIVTDHGILLS